jgi:hypothetical protein
LLDLLQFITPTSIILINPKNAVANNEDVYVSFRA